jgi:uncharacterized membrane protein
MHMLHSVFEWIEVVVDTTAALVMVWAFGMAVFGFVRGSFRATPAEQIRELQLVRCGLGMKLVFALELLIISDLLHTIVSRSMDDLISVAALVVIRTVIAFFLDREMREMSAHLSD